METLPEHLLGKNIFTRSQVRAIVWGLRLTLLILITLFSFLPSRAVSSAVLIYSVGGVGLGLLFPYTEYLLTREIKSATPIKIYQSGVLLPMVHYDWLRGLRGFVPFEQIDHVEVKRRASTR